MQKPPSRRRAASGAFLLSLLLGGCVAVPALPPKPAVRPLAAYAASASLPAGPAAASRPAADWWRAYGDPQLTALIEEGLAGSPDLAAAIARLEQAQGYRQQAGAALLPRLDGKVLAQETYAHSIPGNTIPDGADGVGAVALQLSFDLDLWGKNRAALRAAAHDDEAAALDLAEARLTLSTAIASSYADLARLYAERDVEVQAVRQRQETRDLVAQRNQTGLDTRAELKQAEAAVPAAQASLLATDEQIALTRNALAALLGKGPDRGLAIARPQLTASAQGLPGWATSDVIARRPDVAAALARVQSANERVKVARAGFYPQVSLSGLAAHPGVTWDQLVNNGAVLAGIGPSVTLPFFHGGQIKGEYRSARAQYDAAVAAYDKSVADAFHQLADAVTSQTMLSARLAAARQALADSESAYAIARLRYEGGLSTYLNVLSAEDAVLSARTAYADLASRAFTLDIALVRAAGGGFGPAPASHAAALSKDAPHG